MPLKEKEYSYVMTLVSHDKDLQITYINDKLLLGMTNYKKSLKKYVSLSPKTDTKNLFPHACLHTFTAAQFELFLFTATVNKLIAQHANLHRD
jgi:hypothetical protein